MNVSEFIDPAISARLCLALLHSVWQVALLATVVWAVSRWWQRRSPQTSYLICVLALLTALLAMPITFALVDIADSWQPARDQQVVITRRSVAAASPPVAPSAATSKVASRTSPVESTDEALADEYGDSHEAAVVLGAPQVAQPQQAPWWQRMSPWISCLYVLGVAWMFARLLVSIVRANRLSHQAAVVGSGPMVEMLGELAAKLSIKVRPLLAVAQEAVMPAVIGIVRPTIMLPASTLTGLSESELRMILTHELAHVRRYDMWFNLVQRLAEAMLFFNPAIWHLSRRISRLREYCCDEITCQSDTKRQPIDQQPVDARTRYAMALLRVVELTGDASKRGDALALAATGRSPSELRCRIARLFGESCREPVRVSRGGILVLAAAIFLLFSPAVWRSGAQSPSRLPNDERAEVVQQSPTPQDRRNKKVEVPPTKRPSTARSVAQAPSRQSKSGGSEGGQPVAAMKPARVFPDHLNVMAVGFSRDNRQLISVATEKGVTIRTWNVGDGKLQREVQLDTKLHGNRFTSARMTLCNDLKWLLAMSQGRVQIWNTKTGKLIRELPQPAGRSSTSRGLARTPDGKLIASPIQMGFSGAISSPPDCDVVVWDAVADKVLRVVTHPKAMQITSIALSHDGKRLATGSQEATVCVFEVATGKLLYSVTNTNAGFAHPDPKVSAKGAKQIVSLAFSPDGKQLALGDMLGVKLLDARGGERLHRISSPFRYGYSGLVFSNDGRLLARKGSDKKVPIWLVATGQLLQELPTESHDGQFSSDAGLFVTAFTDRKRGLSLWRLAGRSAKQGDAKQGDEGALRVPAGLGFLASYPNLRELSLQMTEEQFLKIARREKLKMKRPQGDSSYWISTGDGHVVIVMFGNNGKKCSGIQRIRGE